MAKEDEERRTVLAQDEGSTLQIDGPKLRGACSHLESHPNNSSR